TKQANSASYGALARGTKLRAALRIRWDSTGVVIIACTACPAQYSIADAKIRGRKVRITCKHCGAGIVVDATSASTAARVGDGLSFRALERPAPSPSPDADGEATRLAGKGQVPSVQDAPTVSRAVAP